jgi:hypothetical protein
MMNAAVAATYRVFGRYAFAGTSACNHPGIGPLEWRLLRLTPPSELPPALVAAFAIDVSTATGELPGDDFRAILPRLLELVAKGVLPAVHATDALARARYREAWPSEEVAAVERLLATSAVLAGMEPAGADAA